MNLVKTNPNSFFLLFYLLFGFSGVWAQNSPITGEVVLNIGHEQPIERLHFVNQDKYFISMDEYAILNIWDVATGKTVHRIVDSTISTETRFIPTKEPHLLSYDYYGRKCLFNLQTGKIQIEPLPTGDYLESMPLDNDPPFSKILAPSEEKEEVLVPPHPQYFVKTAPDGRVEVWLTKESKMLAVHDFPTQKIEVFVFNQAGNLLLLSDELSIWLWDWKLDKVLYTCSDFLYDSNPKDIGSDLSFVMPDGKVYFLRGRNQHYLKSLDLRTGAEHYLSMPNAFGNRFRKNGQKILAQAQRIHGYSSVLDSLLYPFPPNMTVFNAIKTTHTGQNLALVTHEGKRFILWDAKNQQEKYAIEAADKFYQLCLDDADHLVAIVSKQSINIHELSTGRLIQKIPYQAKSPDQLKLHFFPTSKRILIADPSIYQVTIWDLEAQRQVNSFELKFNIGKVLGISMEDQLIYTQTNRVIVTYDFAGKWIFHHVFLKSDIDAHYFPEEKKIIVASCNGIVYALNALNGQLEKQIYLGEREGWLARSQAGKVETSATGLKYLSYRDQTGKIIQLPSGAYQLRNSAPPLLSSKPNPNGLILKPLERLVKIEPDPYVVINTLWSVKLKDDSLASKKGPFSPHFSPNYHVKSGFFSTDERLVILETNQGIFVIERESGRVLKTLPLFSYNKLSPLLTSDNRYFICVKSAHEIVLIDLWGGQAERSIQLPEQEITTLVLDHGSSHLLLGTNRGYLLQYRLADLTQTKSLKLSPLAINAVALKKNDGELAAADEASNLYFINPKELKIRNVINQASKKEIVNLHFHPLKPLLYIVAERTVFGLSYEQKTFTTTFQFPKSAAYQKIYFNAAMPDRLSYHTEEYEGNRVITYDCIKQQKVDSSAAITTFYGFSSSGRYRLERSNRSWYTADVQTKQIVNIGVPQAALWQLYLHNNTLYYNAKFTEGMYLYGLQLPEDQVRVQVPNYTVRGQLTSEQDEMVLSGSFTSENPGEGKKIIPHSDFSWLITDQEYAQQIQSWNGIYCGIKIPQNDTLYFYNQVEEKLIGKFYAEQKGELPSFCIANNGRWVGLSFWKNKELAIYDLETQIFRELKNARADDFVFSYDDQYLIAWSGLEMQVIDFQNNQMKERIPNHHLLNNRAYLRFMQKFGIIASNEEPYQLWDLERGQKLGNFYFYDAKPVAPHWVFVAENGDYDGSAEALKYLYDVDFRKLRTQTVNPQADSRYTPGLLLKLLKQ